MCLNFYISKKGNIMTTNENTLKNPISTKLKKYVVNLFTQSKEIELLEKSENLELRNILVEYMQKDKTGLKKDGWKMSVLRKIVYDLAEYDSSQKDEFGVSMANKTFENKTTRAIIDAVLLFNRANPLNETKNSKVGYQLNDKGEMCLPFKTLKPTTMETINGVSQEIPNTSKVLVPINVELRRNHFSDLFPEGTRKNKSGTGKTDYEKMMIELNQYLLKLSNDDLIKLLSSGNQNGDKISDFEKYLKALEETIDKVFTRKSGLVQTTDGNIVDTNTAVVNG